MGEPAVPPPAAVPKGDPAIEQTNTEVRALFSSLPVGGPSNGHGKPKSTFNLKSIGQPSPAEPHSTAQPVAPADRKDLPVNEDDLRLAWNQFAKERKDQPAAFALLQRPWHFSEGILHLRLANPVEEPLLDSLKHDLMAYLRDAVRNQSLQIRHTLDMQEQERVPYTNKEKFEFMAQRNPYLQELQVLFGLDAEI